MKTAIPDTYEIIEQGRIEELDSDTLLLRHKKTRARVALLLNDDENKVFYIGFRTPPTDSTGVAHIIEHTVLCGSESFPVKDPFIQLAKGSLNTFLNAMTYPDKTVYPLASCNDQDFKNLMHVYLDAVFCPNIYHDKRFFLQEGWRYELQDATDELTINGIVYNEMKGVMSSPDSVVGRGMRQSLFPDTEYGVDSGGDPEVIPELTYEAYLDFHRRYYHPSNSYIYLYGNLDAFERLDWLDKTYLSGYEYLALDSMPALQKPFDKPRYLKESYSVLPGQSVRGMSYLTYNVQIGSGTDAMQHIALDVLDYALCGAPGAVLKQALIDKGIGTDVYCSFNGGILQPAFSIVAKGADAEQESDFVDTIQETLQGVIRDGFDRKALYAGLNQSEFQFREADFGRYPKGLIYGLEMLDSWLFDDTLPFLHVDAFGTYAALKEKIEEHYFEDLLQKWFLDHPHRTIVTFVPEPGLTEKQDLARKEKLRAYRETLSSDEVNDIVGATKDLKAWQETPDTDEDLRKIPMLDRADLKKEAENFSNIEKTAGNARVLHHDVQTNGICYVSFLFDMEHVPEELFPYAGILKTMLGMVDTAHYGYATLANEINIHTGGFSGSLAFYPRVEDPARITRTFEINMKVLYQELPEAFRLAKEMLVTSDFRDQKRLKEVLDEMKSHMQDDMTAGGHMTAASRALSRLSLHSKLNDVVSGMTHYRLVEALDEEDAIRARGKLSKMLDKLTRVLFRKENLLIDVTVPEQAYPSFEALAAEFADGLFTEPVTEGQFLPALTEANEAFRTAGQVQYVCQAGNFRKAGLSYTGRLHLLKLILSREYFWDNIRVKGGAYGCSCAFGKSGDSFFVTYRDPHLQNSLHVFSEAEDYIASWDADERAMTQCLIGTISDLDAPKTPSAKGSYALTAYLTGTSFADLQRERDELLSSEPADVRALSPYIRAVKDAGVRCVVGSAEKVGQYADLFDTVENLFRGRFGDGEDA